VTRSSEQQERQILTIGISDLTVVRHDRALLTTHALGSCVGISIWDPLTKVSGMLHYMLPQPPSEQMADSRPKAMFGTTGIPALFKLAYELGADKERLVVCAAGAASLLNDISTFQIGRRNRAMMHKLFWKNGIVVAAEDMEGSDARTMSLDTASGRVVIRKRGAEVILWTR
jgi:chemotaxis protein CheD